MNLTHLKLRKYQHIHLFLIISKQLDLRFRFKLYGVCRINLDIKKLALAKGYEEDPTPTFNTSHNLQNQAGYKYNSVITVLQYNNKNIQAEAQLKAWAINI